LSLFQRIAGAALGLVLFALAFVFASVILAVAAVLALGVWGWLWWKTRELRRQMRQQLKDFPPSGATVEREIFRDETYEGEVIEGEAVRVDTKRDTP